ncbi:thiamine phosphate synthase [Dyadobacter frigoris]|uniref:Thiamine phosphate synthase n=1 Tax=Dyadobacter frigoris TaxID=2576211 RepID=A0A4U6CYV8_9BACT|nr:thiamine phosphate synthase [Dyadobacter frigoris]TKT88508.1 thiamine phosphate synthase [Dyadobacter frigoris]GLU54551.1 thiamine phosphate synthase [Dyadobacter frigoris]
MKLLAISNPAFFPDEAGLINSLFREGLVCLHIRKPESEENDFKNLLSKINSEFIDRIAIHQHHNLAGEFGIKKLHFTEKERSQTSMEILKNLKSDDFLLSTSIHDLTEIGTLLKYFSYTFFGPVFDSISKAGYKGVLPENFSIKPEINKIPIIGLGGISSENMEKVSEMGFDGAAVLGTLWKETENVVANFRKLREVVNFINQCKSS